MNFYVTITPSHNVFLERLITNIPKSLNLIINECDQKCPSGVFASKGWNDTTRDKLEFIYHACQKDDVFLIGDLDLQFFGDPVEDLLLQLGDADIAFQQETENKGICSGFFVCRGNDRTRQFFSTCLENHHKFRDDQETIINFRKMINYNLLDEKYWSVWRENGGAWNNQLIDVPSNILMHHANWCFYDKKIELLDLVSHIYKNKKIKVL